MTVIIGLVADRHAFLSATALLLMLRDRATTLRSVVFVAGNQEPTAAQSAVLVSAGAWRVVRLNPMPIPEGNFSAVLGAGRHGRRIMFERLGLWSHDEYHKILLLDLDLHVARNIDEMATFPRNTFSPNICQYGCAHRVAGHNSGVMVIGPSRARFDEMVAYAKARANGAAVGRAQRLPLRQSRQRSVRRQPLHELLVDQEQSFLAEFYADVHGINIEADAPERAGHEWTWRSFVDTSLCVGRDTRDISPCGGVVHIMSRRYNARPGDCNKCPASYRPSLVHFACAAKPFQRYSIKASRRYWEAMHTKAAVDCGRASVCSSCVAESQLGYLVAFEHAEALWNGTKLQT